MHLPSPGLSRLAIVVAALTLLLIATGALATGDAAGSALPASLINGRYHLLLGLAVVALTVLLLIRLAPANVPAWVRATGWIAVSLGAIDSAMMAWTPAPPVAAALAIPHAIVAPVFFAAIVVIAFYTWLDWINTPEPIDTSAWPSLPTMALAAPPLVLAQIALGAAYRHKAFGVMPHMAGAMLATLLLLVLCVALLQNFPSHPALRPVAIASMSVLLLQVMLGIAAFIMRLLDFDTTAAFVFLAAAHVCAGALTLAASVVLYLEVRRCGPAGN